MISVEKFGKGKNSVLTGYRLDKTPVRGKSMDVAPSPQGRGGTAPPPTGAPTSSVRGTRAKGNSTSGAHARTTAADYLNEPVNYGGIHTPRGEVIADLRAKGGSERESVCT